MPRETFRSYTAVFHCKTTGFGRRAEGRQLHQKQLRVFSDSASGLECAITSGADSFLAGKLEGSVSCEDGGWSSQWCHLQQFQDMSPLWVQAACRWDTVPSTQPGKPAELAWSLLWGYQQGHHRYFYLSDPSSILMWGKKFDVSHCVIYNPRHILHGVFVFPTPTRAMGFPFPAVHQLLTLNPLSNAQDSLWLIPQEPARNILLVAPPLSFICSSERRTKWTAGHCHWESTISSTDLLSCSLSPIL